jgi:effector-binding domain-containing protein
MMDTPEIVQTTAQPTAVIRLVVPRDQIRDVMGASRRELMDAVAAQGAVPAGPWFTHHFKAPGETFDFEIGVPVKTPIAPAGRVQPSELPATRVARTVYRGPYDGLGSAWSEFTSWIGAQGQTPAQDLWEVYVAGPESGPDPATWRTELNRPLSR